MKKKYINHKAIVKQDTNKFSIKFSYFIIVIFSVFLAIGMYYHEMWRDEIEIYSKIAFSGTKFIVSEYSYFAYNLLIKVSLWVNESQTMFQFCHYIIILSAIFLLNKYSPFNLFEKFFITFSYFLFFEYGIISRYYGFLVLMVFIILFLLSRKKVNYYLIIIPLIILANHSINSYIIALSLFLYIINDLFKKLKDKTLTKRLIISYTSVFLCFVLIGLIYLMYTTKQKSQFEGLGEAPYFMTIRTIWNSFVPLPKFTNTASFWNTNFFDFPIVYPLNYDITVFKTSQNIFLFILSLFILIIILIKFSKKPVVFWVFLFNYILLLLFLHIARFYFIRHQGLLFIVFIYSYWLYHISDGKIHLPVLKKVKLDVLSKLKLGLLFKPMIMGFLILQFVSSSYAFYKDIKYKFTLSHDAAKFIKDNNLDKDHEMIGYIDYSAQAIAINLKKKMYFPQGKSYNYFWSQFDKNYNRDIPITDVFEACTNYTEKQQKKVLLILNFPLTDNKQQQLSNAMLTQKTSISLLQSFTGDIIQSDEQYWIYECKMVKQ